MNNSKINKNLLQKISGSASIIGTVMIFIGALLVPKARDITNIVEMQKAYGANPRLLQLSALFMLFGFWSLFVGLLGIEDLINEAGAIWARIGFYFNFMGTIIWTIGMSLDISYPAAITNWLSTQEANIDVAYSVVTVLSPYGIGRGLFPIEVITIWISYIFIGVGMFRSDHRYRWQGGTGIILGIAGLVLGIIMVFTGREKLISFFIIIMSMTLIWFLINGINMLCESRKSKFDYWD